MKELAFSAEKAIFPNLKGTLSLGARKTLTQFRASWRPEKGIFSEPERNRFFS